MVRLPAAVEAFLEECADAGFDVAQCFDTRWCDDDASLQLPAFGRNGALAVVIGNTRRLWPILLREVAQRPQWRDTVDVIDAYAEERIARAAAGVGVRSALHWAHIVDGHTVPIQRIAARAGLAWLSPAHLCVHPRFGPWIGLRAVVVFDLPPPDLTPPLNHDPCGSCASGCLTAFRATDDDWHSWLAVRDACPLGHDYRYSDEQILYHYTKDRAALRTERLD